MCGVQNTVTPAQAGTSFQSHRFLMLIALLLCPRNIRDPVPTDSTRAASGPSHTQAAWAVSVTEESFFVPLGRCATILLHSSLAK